MAQSRYLPYGQERWITGTLTTDFTFTGQRNDNYTHLIEMGDRWYDPYLNRWISPDSIVPQASNSQSLNRYSYVHNNPVRYYDSDGHCLPFCIGAYLVMRSVPREYAGAGARFVANQGIPIVSDVAAFDAANMDNMWLAVNGDKVGLTAEQRTVAYAKGTGGAILEAAAVYGSVALGARAIAGAKTLIDLVRGLTQNGKVAEAGEKAAEASEAVLGKGPLTRALSASDLGIKGNISQFDATLSVAEGKATIRIDMIEGKIENPFEMLQNAQNLARGQGANVLRIEGTVINPDLLDIITRRYGAITEGANESLEILLK